MTTNVLKIKGLTKKFGRITAVNGLDLTIEKGQVYGILGPNGSGKTTTLGMLLDVISPTKGSYAWFDDMHPTSARKKVGSILETPSFYPYLTAVQNLRIASHIKQADKKRIDIVLEHVKLHERKNDKFKTYSLGMKQRLAIASALLSDPPVMILDEPTNGLDPEGIAEVRDLIRDIANRGKTIILASHLLDEVQKVCTHFCVLKNGVKLHEGPVQDILGETNEVEISAENMTLLDKKLEDFGGVMSKYQQNGSIYAQLNENFSSSDINKYCFENGITLRKLLPKSKSLEQEFLKILKEND